LVLSREGTNGDATVTWSLTASGPNAPTKEDIKPWSGQVNFKSGMITVPKAFTESKYFSSDTGYFFVAKWKVIVNSFQLYRVRYLVGP
jgi:hypothetical protein